MSNITLFQSDHSCENIYKDQKTKKLSVVNSPYIFSDWDWMKLFNVKRSYILSMVIHLKEWYFSLNWKMTTSTLLKIWQCWFLAKCGKAAASSPSWHTCFFSFPPQTTWPYYFPHIVFLLCLLTESILCSHWSLWFLYQVWNCSIMHLLLQ